VPGQKQKNEYSVRIIQTNEPDPLYPETIGGTTSDIGIHIGKLAVQRRRTQIHEIWKGGEIFGRIGERVGNSQNQIQHVTMMISYATSTRPAQSELVATFCVTT